MAINWESIEGYREDMTSDEKLELLNNYEPPKAAEADAPSDDAAKGGEKMISKKAYDKVASDLAAVKRQLRSRMSEEEAKEQERADADEKMRLELETLRKEKTISTYKAQHLAQGYDNDAAQQIAEVLAEGDMDEYFRLVAKQNAIKEKNLRAQILKETPVPPASDDSSHKEDEEIKKLRKYMGLN